MRPCKLASVIALLLAAVILSARAQTHEEITRCLSIDDARRQAACLNEERSSRDAARERARAEWRRRHHWAKTKTMGVVEGAIVCSDLRTVQYMFDAVVQHRMDAFQDVVTRGQSRLMRRSYPSPDFEAHGCSFLPSGTRMLVDAGNVVPIVTAEANGQSIKGVTMWGMFTYEENAPCGVPHAWTC
jgi:hypothetical protein